MVWFRKRRDSQELHPIDGVEVQEKPRSRGGCCSRRCCCCSCCCCVILTIIVLLIAIAVVLLAFFLSARSPEVNMLGVKMPTDGRQAFSLDGDNLVFNFDLRFSVENPNFLGADIKELDGTGYWPSLPDVPMGTGSLKNIHIDKRSNTTIDFPVTLRYDPAKDPKRVVLNDLVRKCGLSGKREPLKINYKVDVHVKVLAITVSPTIEDSATFDCPIPDISSLNIPDLGSVTDILGGLSKAF
ncbi:hypothetical protein H4R35_005216 [Dimargaris xerosporica]|nr:hypothetical protein H4R35_005216 [Dimargaris xerosporica]